MQNTFASQVFNNNNNSNKIKNNNNNKGSPSINSIREQHNRQRVDSTTPATATRAPISPAAHNTSNSNKNNNSFKNSNSNNSRKISNNSDQRARSIIKALMHFKADRRRRRSRRLLGFTPFRLA